jgi:phenylacetate-CoA ligase
MIWDRAAECLPRPDLLRLQGERLARLVARVHERVPFYRTRLREHGVDPASVQGVADLSRLPFTRKADLRDHYPLGLLAVPPGEVARVHASSGTAGKPTVVAYTRGDLDVWAEACARCLALSGAEPGQVFQNAYGYGLFTGGLGLHAGAERFGLAVVPASAGNTARQILLLQDLGTAVLACTPSYALTLADALESRGVRPESLRLRTLILGAEPWTEPMRQELEARLRAHALNIYGLSEVMGPGVSNECVEAKDGSHLCEDHVLVEVIDPATGDVLPEGAVGELVVTTLTREAMPLLRYRSGDLASVTTEPCRYVFPSQVEAALVGVGLLSPHHQLVVTRVHHLDALEVRVEVAGAVFQEVGPAAFAAHAQQPVEALHRLECELRRRLHEALGVGVAVSLRPPDSLPRSEGGKLRRVLDERGG